MKEPNLKPIDLGSLPRVSGWETRLLKMVRRFENQPFSWKENDCLSFAGKCVGAITGTDPVDCLRYWDAASALSIILDHGSDLRDFAEYVFGKPLEGRPGRGDVVLLDIEGRPAFGICMGKTVLSTGETRLQAVPARQWIAFWMVGG